MFRFLHAADIHLDSPLRGLEAYPDAPVEQIRGAVRRAFDRLISLAIEQEVAFILLAGDLFDGDWKDYNTGLYFLNRMGRLREAGIRVLIVSGNHDAAGRITRALRLPDNVTLFSHERAETRILEDLGVAVHGRSFPSRSVSEDLTRQYPPRREGLFNIGLLHTALTGRPGHEPYAPCTPDKLRSNGYHYWALGHVHQREQVACDPWILFPGSIQGRHIRETGPKGCTLVSVDQGCVHEIVHHDLDVLRWSVCRVDLSGCDTEEASFEISRRALEDELDRAEDRPVAIRLVLEGQTPLHGSLHERSLHWTEEFRGLAAGLGRVWLEKIVFRTWKKEDAGEIHEQDSPISALKEAIEDLRRGKPGLLDLMPEFQELRSRLPPELLGEDEPFHLPVEEFEELCEQLKGFLMGKMLRNEGRHED